MDYLGWNDSIARSFFNPQAAQRPIYLYITEERLELIGRAEGVGKDDFLRAVLEGPSWITDGRLSLCGTALRACNDWRQGRAPAETEFPPYIAYLALFVLAAGVEGEFASHAYYPRLHRLLGEPEGTGAPPVFDRMWELWLDLEEWSKADKNGELGILNINFSGSWQHVGLPIGQTLLSEEERHKLVDFFAANALDPSAPPTESEMLILLREDRNGSLQRRSQRVLDSAGEAEVRSALVQAVISELQHWDGQVLETAGSEELATSIATLRLCCRLDKTAGRADFRLRLRSSADFPEGELHFEGSALPEGATCEEAALGWSTELLSKDTGAPIDAAAVPWAESFELADRQVHWRAAMPASRTHLFILGSEFGLPHFVEAARLPRGREFLLLARDRLAEIDAWGKKSCSNFTSVTVANGLQAGWQLFHAAGASDDAAIRDIFPRLALPSSLRISFKGGVRTQEGAASRYLAFSPPAILVDTPAPDVSVTCNGEVLQQREVGVQVYDLPTESGLDTPLRIEARIGSGDDAHATLTLAGGILARWQEQAVRFDPYGLRTVEPRGTRGAEVYEFACDPFNFGVALPPMDASKAYLVGQFPGEISCWPNDPLPPWQPVWAVAMRRRRGVVIPCMADCDDAAPKSTRNGSAKEIKTWKEVVWHWRKRVTPPPDAPYSALWDKYKEAASNV